MSDDFSKVISIHSGKPLQVIGNEFRDETQEQAIARALRVLDQMRERVAAGELDAFFAVCIYPDDLTTVCRSNIRPCTYLRMGGALAFAMARLTDPDSDI